MPKSAPTKKVVIFIVEGGTDKSALENILKKIYANKNVHFEVTSGDITSDKDITLENVEEQVYKYVERCIRRGKFRKSDIWGIVQLFDTDGAYIPDELILEGDVDGFFYTATNIVSKSIERVQERNSKKSQLMDHLKALDSINSIPYRGYYFSCNLDHALYNEQNLTLEEKDDYADEFYRQFRGKETVFIDFLKQDVANGVSDRYRDSWKFIMEKAHSLARHTNFHIYFEENPYWG